jgi:3-deoxy-D-manno-octulosonic acid kinase
MILNRTIDSYCFGSFWNLTELQLRTLTALMHQTDVRQVPALDGRTSVTPVQLDGIGSLVIKHYRRGGLLRYLIKGRYLRVGKTRGQREFELLDLAGSSGIHVPQPVAYAYRGRLFYAAWLVTRSIREPVTLARLSQQDVEEARQVVPAAAEQIGLLIKNKILHVDLHPGNVVIDDSRQVYLLDFDKGRVFRGSREKLKDRYIARWRRAVDKHRLPDMLNDALRTELKTIRI